MNIAAVLRELMAAGLSGEALVEAVERIESSSASDPMANAIRQARYRERGGARVPAVVRRAIFERDGFACVECDATDRLECDHIHPVSKGGSSEPENLQTLCRSCNARKGDRIRKAEKRGQVRTCSDNTDKSTPPAFPLDVPPKDINQTPPLIPQSPPPKINPTGAKSVRGTRLPTDFSMPADWLDWAVVDRGWQQLDATEEAAAFVDFWHAKAGANGCKLDWQATWRNWCRNSRRQSNAKRNRPICGNGQPGRGGNVRVNAALDLHAEALERERREAEGVIEGDGDYWGIGAAVSALQ